MSEKPNPFLRPKKSRRCPVCREPLTGLRKDAIYCSGRCRAQASRERAAQRAKGPWDELWDSLVGKGSQRRTDRVSGGRTG
jgi:hypothetical protein